MRLTQWMYRYGQLVREQARPDGGTDGAIVVEPRPDGGANLEIALSSCAMSGSISTSGPAIRDRRNAIAAALNSADALARTLGYSLTKDDGPALGTVIADMAVRASTAAERRPS